ncbi:MAG TPA: lysophospholipid acyltransferase family protein [Myxococcota bacterium]|nr:lysophospholipid acyltransferase family protein [Myxococcota bacterium]
MKICIKGVLFVVILLSFFATCLVFFPFRLISPWGARRVLAQVLCYFARVTLWVFGINCRVVGRDFGHVGKEPHALCLSNHVSYLDVVILASLRPVCFVTSQEVKEDWFLGPITRVAACLYVERRNRRKHFLELEELSEALRNGLSVLFFPEATSTNAERVLRFRGLLFRAAIYAEVPVKPYCLNYLSVNGQPWSTLNRDVVCWYGSMQFGPHFFAFLQQDRIDVEIVDLPLIAVDAATNRNDLIELSHHYVARSFKPVAGSSSSLADNVLEPRSGILLE